MTTRRKVALAGIGVLLISLVRTAWVSDDAYITFRTVDNFVHGYGLTWNVDERVQSFTHPLWLAAFTPFYAVTREPYYTSMALGALLTLAAVALLAGRIAVTEWSLLACIAALLSSKAFIDFSTSGLENPLTYLLLVMFLWRWWEEPHGERRTRRLSLLAGLCLLNRTDLALLVGPALAWDAWRLGPRAALKPVVIGLLPLIGWECFSAFYYGSFVPNTAYAKLSTGFPIETLVSRGLDYFHRTLVTDPVTLPIVAVGLCEVMWRRWRSDWPLAAGVVLSLGYVLWIGGDFMMGRFFTGPFVWSVAILARAAWLAPRRNGMMMAAACVVTGLLAPWEPALISGYGYARMNNILHGVPGQVPLDRTAYLHYDEIMDERRFYYESSGLLKGHRGQHRPDHPWAFEGIELRERGARLEVRGNIGFCGYFAGPGVHIVDFYALSEPLLARITARGNSAAGHYQRDLPQGYLDTLRTGVNHIVDPDLSVFYERLHLVTTGPLWSRERLMALPRWLLNRDQVFMDRFLTRWQPGQ